MVITPEYDLLHAEGLRYAERLRTAGALAAHHDVPGADHGYDDAPKAAGVHAFIAEHIRQAGRDQPPVR